MGLMQDLDGCTLANMKDGKGETSLTITRADGTVVNSTNFIALISDDSGVKTLSYIGGDKDEITHVCSVLAQILSHYLDAVTGRIDE